MKRSLLFIALLLLASSCFARGDGPGAAVPRRVLLSLARDRTAAFTEGEALMISRSLLARLQAASSEYIMIERPVSEVTESESDLSAEAGKEGADGWVSVTLSGSWSSMRIAVRAFDLSDQWAPRRPVVHPRWLFAGRSPQGGMERHRAGRRVRGFTRRFHRPSRCLPAPRLRSSPSRHVREPGDGAGRAPPWRSARTAWRHGACPRHGSTCCRPRRPAITARRPGSSFWRTAK